MKIAIVVVGFVMWVGLCGFAEENGNAMVTNSPETRQAGQIKKQILDLHASLGSYVLVIRDSSAIVTARMVSGGKAGAVISFDGTKGKPVYLL